MNCRVCKSETVKYDLIEDNTSDVTHFYNEPILEKKSNIEVYKCPNCGHIQTEFSLDDSYYEDYNIIYNPQSDNASGYPKKLLAYYEKCFIRMKAFSDKTADVLDVGCAAGDMISILSKSFDECEGIEPSENLSAEAHRRGFKVINGYFDDSIKFDKRFNFITCLMVLEHIEDLQGFMRTMYNNLSEDGVVLINVPNGQKISDVSAYTDIFPEHINYFTIQSFTKLAYSTNFEILCIEEGFGDGFHLTAWLKKKAPVVTFSQKKLMEQNELNSITDRYTSIGIWGIGVRARNILNLISPDSIRYYFDSNESLKDKYIPGVSIPISLPSRNQVDECDLIMITSIEYYDEIIKILKNTFKYRGSIVYLKNGKYTFYE